MKLEDHKNFGNIPDIIQFIRFVIKPGDLMIMSIQLPFIA